MPQQAQLRSNRCKKDSCLQVAEGPVYHRITPHSWSLPFGGTILARERDLRVILPIDVAIPALR
jgi:hypothetical protein